MFESLEYDYLYSQAVKVLEMSRDDRRDSYLRSEHCHMCGHMLGPGMSFIRKPGGKKEVCFSYNLILRSWLLYFLS